MRNFFSAESRLRKAADRIADEVMAIEKDMAALTDTELLARANALREKVQSGKVSIDDITVESFALVREATWRKAGMRHYRVQLIGGVMLQYGMIAELRTGEGKTIVALLAAFTRSLEGKGVHIVTANEYLVTVGAELAEHVLGALGTTVGAVYATEPGIDTKRQAYACDITYGTASEIGFDYLRDNAATDIKSLMQRGFNYAIVDEVDSVLIDEAKTPLILAGPGVIDMKGVQYARDVANQLQKGVDYEVNMEDRLVYLTDRGWGRAEELYKKPLLEPSAVRMVAQLRNAISAKELNRRDHEYLVDDDGNVQIIDEGTGRTLTGRRWSWGLHQAIEVKEGVTVQPDTRTIASITLQYLFRKYETLAGMTGTAMPAKDEFAVLYKLDVIEIPTNAPVIRKDEDDTLWPTAGAKYANVVDDIQECVKRGQPVLVGAPSLAESEELSGLLQARGITHNVLNAKMLDLEAHIVAQAGRIGSVTVATNMAGRGVDIKLGGDPDAGAQDELAGMENPDEATAESVRAKWSKTCQEEGDKVRALGGLRVIGCARHTSRRVDNQLRGRAGRQGDPGSSKFYVSLEDELLAPFASGPLKAAARLDRSLEGRIVSAAIERAQEQHTAEDAVTRMELFESDSAIDAQRNTVYGQRTILLNIKADDSISGADKAEEALLAVGKAAISALVAKLVVVLSEREVTDDSMFASAAIRWKVADESSVRDAMQYVRDGEPEVAEQILFDDFTAAVSKRRIELGDNMFKSVVTFIIVGVYDTNWLDHLEDLEALKEAVSLRGTAGTNVRTVWQHEAYELFTLLQNKVAETAIKWVMFSDVSTTPPEGMQVENAPVQA